MTANSVSYRTLIAVATASSCCFAASLLLPCLYIRGGDSAFDGLSLLLWGPFGVLAGVVAWYANPLLPPLLTLLLLRRFRLAVLCGVPCLLLALSTFTMREMLVSERPDYAAITGYGLGFYLWLASFAIPLAFALVCLHRSRNSAASRHVLLAEVVDVGVEADLPNAAGVAGAS